MNIKKLSRVHSLFVCLLFFVSAYSFADTANNLRDAKEFSSHYTLTFSETTPNEVLVNASIHVSRGKIRMLSWGHPWLENGWATFVEDLRIDDQAGNAIDYSLIEEDGWGAWEVPVEDETKINLSYVVKLNHVNFDWNKAGGQDSRPEWVNGALFAVSRAFFIYSYLDSKSVVNFEYPESWNVALPWKKANASENSYFVPSKQSLVSNAFVIGDFSKRVLNLDGFKISIAIDHSLKQYLGKIERILNGQSAAYKEIFGDLPEMGEYVVSFRAADEDDGEAYYNSFNQVIKERSISSNDTNITWANTMGHEMFHNWFGDFILNRTTYEDTANKYKIEWFNEGFTEYFTSKALYSQGLIPVSGYLKKLEKYAARYFITSHMWPEEQTSLAQSGKHKHKNWLQIYGGGFSLFCPIHQLNTEPA